MTDLSDTFEQIDGLIDAIRRRGERPVGIRIGPDRKVDFESRAGAGYVTDGSGATYFGLPISFDAIDPTTVLVESEPA